MQALNPEWESRVLSGGDDSEKDFDPVVDK